MKFYDREITIKGEFVSCSNCAVCYDHEMKPTFCQYFLSQKNPLEIEENHKTARECKEFCPNGLPKHMRKSQEKSIWQLSEEERMNIDREMKLKEILIEK